MDTYVEDDAESDQTLVGDSSTPATGVPNETIGEASRSAGMFANWDHTMTESGESHSGGAAKAPAKLQLGRYTLLENFAHGGMGAIWRAEDVHIHREVAYKELLPNCWRSRTLLRDSWKKLRLRDS